MIHRALFGSIERFMGVLTEHYAGAFPAWLAPEQVIAIPVADAFNDYMYDIVDRLKGHGIRARVDDSTDRFPKKIRTASKHKAPFVLIAGGEDAEASAVSFRYRDGSQVTVCLSMKPSMGYHSAATSTGIKHHGRPQCRARRQLLMSSHYPVCRRVDRLWTPHRMAMLPRAKPGH